MPFGISFFRSILFFVGINYLQTERRLRPWGRKKRINGSCAGICWAFVCFCWRCLCSGPWAGAAFAMREILPGQVSAAEPTGEKGADTTGEVETAEEPAKETGLFGIDDLKFKEEEQVAAAYLPREEVERMQDFSYLQKKYYTTDSRTMLLPTDINVNDALAKDFTIDTEVEGPKVLIFHTHISEAFADSDMSKGKEEGSGARGNI